MPVTFHPKPGTIVLCDYDTGFVKPEMVKRRPAVVVSPPISVRAGLCTIVPLSTTPPKPALSYHCMIVVDPPLPDPWTATEMWVKGDMVFAASFQRIDLVRFPKEYGKERKYRLNALPDYDLKRIHGCILCSFGLAHLTKHL